jgi:hypothetical protein
MARRLGAYSAPVEEGGRKMWWAGESFSNAGKGVVMVCEGRCLDALKVGAIVVGGGLVRVCRCKEGKYITVVACLGSVIECTMAGGWYSLCIVHHSLLVPFA